MVPESPRWLLSCDRVNEARRLIQKIARMNKSYVKLMGRLSGACQRMFLWRRRRHVDVAKGDSDEVVESAMERCEAAAAAVVERTVGRGDRVKLDVEHDEAWDYVLSLLRNEANKLSSLRQASSYKQTVAGILKSPVMLKRCFILLFTWMVILAVYLGIGMGISGNLDKLIDPYLVFSIAAVCEFVSIVTCHMVLNRYGRKLPLVAFMYLSSVAIYLIPVYYESRPAVSVAFYFVAKYAIGAAQLTCMIFTSELYPTPLRSTGVGLSVALARLGGVWAPQINVLSATLGSIYIPFVIFSIVSLVAGTLCLMLPETLNKLLPESLSDAKALNKKQPR